MTAILLLIAVALTVLLNFEIYRFNYVYRRSRGDRTLMFLLSTNSWRLLSQLFQRQNDPALRRLQLRFRVAAGLGPATLLALFVSMSRS